jgi:hypothetical protein
MQPRATDLPSGNVRKKKKWVLTLGEIPAGSLKARHLSAIARTRQSKSGYRIAMQVAVNGGYVARKVAIELRRFGARRIKSCATEGRFTTRWRSPS